MVTSKRKHSPNSKVIEGFKVEQTRKMVSFPCLIIWSGDNIRDKTKGSRTGSYSINLQSLIPVECVKLSKDQTVDPKMNTCGETQVIDAVIEIILN